MHLNKTAGPFPAEDDASQGFFPAAFTAVDAAAARFRAETSLARALGFMKAGAFGRLQNRPKKVPSFSALAGLATFPPGFALSLPDDARDEDLEPAFDGVAFTGGNSGVV